MDTSDNSGSSSVKDEGLIFPAFERGGWKSGFPGKGGMLPVLCGARVALETSSSSPSVPPEVLAGLCGGRGEGASAAAAPLVAASLKGNICKGLRYQVS